MGGVLLIGKNGQLGRALDRPEVIGGDATAVGRQDCDLLDLDRVREVIGRVAPRIIVNAAAYTAVDRAEDEPDLAHAVNAEAPAVLAREALRHDAVLVHFSTDYVFSGTRTGPHVETDPTGPLGVYGASKLAGEQAVLDSGCRATVLRTAWVYSAHGANFPRTMLRLARERTALAVVADQFGTPTSATLLADVTGRVIARLAEGESQAAALQGVFHCAAAGCTNWRDYAVFFLSCCRDRGIALRLDPQAITAIPGSAYPTRARRPKNSLLSSAKLEQTLAFSMPDWHEGVRELAETLAQA